MKKNIKIFLFPLIFVLIAVAATVFWFSKQKDLLRKQEIIINKNEKIAPCGDGICDLLEKKDARLCPQDCVSNVVNNVVKNNITQEGVVSHFGFLNAYGPSMAKLSEKWESNFNKDLIETSSDLMKDISAGWSREFVFVYPFDYKDSYSLEKFKKAKENGTKLIITVGVEERQMNDIKYEEWLKGILGYYSGYVKYWQVHNEIGSSRRFPRVDSYITLLKETSGLIKGGCSDCKIMMSSFAPDTSSDYYGDVIKKGSSYVDAYDFHIFNEGQMSVFKNFVSKVDKPVFVTEMATYSGDPAETKNVYQSETQQAEKLIKWYVQAFDVGADYVFWSQFIEWYEFWGKVDGMFDFTGLVYNGMCLSKNTGDVCGDILIDKGTGVKKEAYYSLKTLIAKVDGFTAVKKIKEGQYEFVVNEKSVYVLWCDSDNCSLSDEIRGVTSIVDYRGEKIGTSLEKVKLSSSPVFAY